MKARRTPMSGLTATQLQHELADAHELMVTSGIAAPTLNEDCPACTVPSEMYSRLVRATSDSTASDTQPPHEQRDIGPVPIAESDTKGDQP